jgi:hypothetical protein
MSESPRRGFQIHLSTAVVLMVAAGGMLSMNLTPRNEKKEGHPRSLCYGWPQDACSIPQESYTIPVEPYTVKPGGKAWTSGGVVIDFGAAAAILIVVALMCEAFVHRHEARKV